MLSEINLSQKDKICHKNILYAFTYMRSLEQSNSYRQKECWIPGVARRENGH